MITNEVSVCVIVPTRDRATLAMNAINSVLVDKQLQVQIFVSDNSTEATEAESLGKFCQKLDDHRLIYKRASHDMNLGDHWEWAMEQALIQSKASHLLFLTDRMVFNRKELEKILSAVYSFPDSIITYGHDVIVDSLQPVHLVQESWTGQLYSIESTELLRLSAQMTILHVLPRMMNSVVPRKIFEKLHGSYDCVFGANAPDFVFAYKCLECCDTILYLDCMSLVHYALKQSTGGNQAKGVFSKETTESFIKSGSIPFNYSAPVPEFITLRNSIIHAYLLVKKQSGSSKFPDINYELYYEMINKEIDGITSPELQTKMRSILSQQVRCPSALLYQRLLRVGHFIFSWRSWYVKFFWTLTAPKFQPIWNMAHRYLKIEMPSIREITTEFDSVEDAINFASEHPRRPNRGISYLESIAKFKRVPFSGSS